MKGKVTNEPNPVSNYKKGLDILREKFKECKFNNNYDGMADAIENIKSEIKSKMIANGDSDVVKRIENICKWYRTKESHYVRPTPEGNQIIFPPDIVLKVNMNLTVAYELLIRQLDKLNLL